MKANYIVYLIAIAGLLTAISIIPAVQKTLKLPMYRVLCNGAGEYKVQERLFFWYRTTENTFKKEDALDLLKSHNDIQYRRRPHPAQRGRAAEAERRCWRQRRTGGGSDVPSGRKDAGAVSRLLQEKTKCSNCGRDLQLKGTSCACNEIKIAV